jgi:DNA polymerase-3 subunit alpha
MAKIKSLEVIDNESVSFADVRHWFDEHMLVDKIDLTDQKVFEYVYHGARWAGIFQLTSKGAQRLFEAAKPSSIEEIAVLTSVYRPGPLAAGLDKLWLKVLQGEEYDWGDKRVNKILEKTRGLLIFQEGVMALAEHVGGFPKDKCDEVRRAIMKRSVSGEAAAKAAAEKLKSEFVDGAVKNGYSSEVATSIFEKIQWFAGYGFNCLSGDTLVQTLERGSVTIKDVVPGEHVLSQDGYVKVLNQLDMGKNEVYEVTTKSGKRIKCTLDHKLMTPDGLKTLDEILKSEKKTLVVKHG